MTSPITQRNNAKVRESSLKQIYLFRSKLL